MRTPPRKMSVSEYRPSSWNMTARYAYQTPVSPVFQKTSGIADTVRRAWRCTVWSRLHLWDLRPKSVPVALHTTETVKPHKGLTLQKLLRKAVVASQDMCSVRTALYCGLLCQLPVSEIARCTERERERERERGVQVLPEPPRCRVLQKGWYPPVRLWRYHNPQNHNLKCPVLKHKDSLRSRANAVPWGTDSLATWQETVSN
jgi:hypothetical protein